MATGEGFVIPARVVVSVEGLSQVRSQLESFVAAAKGAAKVDQRPVDPRTGAQASVQTMREETGAALNAARQAGATIRRELDTTDLSKKRRAELEAELRVYEKLERQIYRTTTAARTEGGKIQPPIFPAEQWRYPSMAAGAKGAKAQPPERPIIPGTPVGLPAVRTPTSQLKSDMESFIATMREAKRVGAQPIDPTTGAGYTVRRMREETGAALNEIRRAANNVRQEMAKGDVTPERRQKLEAEIKTWQTLERQVKRTTEAFRSVRGDVRQPIFPADQWKFPTVSQGGKGAVPTPPLQPVPKPSLFDRPDWKPAPQPSLFDRPGWRPPQPPPPAPPREVPVAIRPRRAEGVGKEEILAEGEKELSLAEKRLARAINSRAEIQTMLTAEGRLVLEQEAALSRERAQVKAIEAQIRSTDREYLKATADAAVAREEEAHRIAIFRAGGDPGDLRGEELRAQAALVARTSADRERAAIARRTGAEELEVMAQRKLDS